METPLDLPLPTYIYRGEVCGTLSEGVFFVHGGEVYMEGRCVSLSEGGGGGGSGGEVMEGRCKSLSEEGVGVNLLTRGGLVHGGESLLARRGVHGRKV